MENRIVLGNNVSTLRSIKLGLAHYLLTARWEHVPEKSCSVMRVGKRITEQLMNQDPETMDSNALSFQKYRREVVGRWPDSREKRVVLHAIEASAARIARTRDGSYSARRQQLSPAG
jgi:hypothetical protein